MAGISVSSKKVYIPEGYLSKLSIIKILVYVILITWGLTTIVPMLWVAVNSFKTSSEILSGPISMPKSLNFNNYATLYNYTSLNIFKGFYNSLIISGSVVVLISLLGGIAAFVLGRFKFKLNKVIIVFLVVSMLTPQFAVIVPNMFTFKQLHLNNSYLALIIPHVAGFLNFAIILLTGFMASLPVELEEAAIIDGCSIPGIFAKITVPLSIPAFATVSIMVFLWSYNDLLQALVYLPRPKQPVTVLLAMVSNIYGTDYGAMMTAVFVTLLPVLILYVISQEYVIKGLTSGAVKG